ncbi:MAG: HAD-IA family hydrolase [Candidatus Hydrogenedentes bacterium]|nr:HAD-IA family hydrolase [Candidatus Hydrogenedentota bacterium]
MPLHSAPHTVRAVVFDLDGTLIDSTNAIVQSFLHTFDAIGEPRPAREAIIRSIGYTLEQQFALFTRHDPGDCARIYRSHYAEICCPMTSLMPGAREALDALNSIGLRLGFATSKRRLYAEMILEHLRVLHYFDVRIGPDDVTRPKPAPDAMLRALELFALAPGEVLFIGDSHFDVECARAAGVACLCVTTGYETRAELEELRPAGIYDSLREVADHVLFTR